MCRRQIERGAASCPSCGAPVDGRGGDEFELLFADRTHVPVVRELTIGRARGNTLQLGDPSVSARHARISPTRNGGGPVLRDVGSRYGTWVDGHRITSPVTLHDGARIEVGDQEVVVQRRRSAAESGRTILVPPGASLVVTHAGATAAHTRFGARPRLRSGYALKRLAASEGERRWVLRDIVGGTLLRFSDADARLIGLLDGRHSIGDLVVAAERRLGAAGPARLAVVLADLGAAGLLAGSEAGEQQAEPRGLARLLRPRVRTWAGAGDFFDRVYGAGGWRLFTRFGLTAIALTALGGAATFGFLVAARYGTPFVVAKKVAVGGAVFIAGRLAVAALHETAHGLTLASFGRRVGDAGLKLVLIFPYVFVDTSDAWFERRRRRIAVTAAGPVSDFTLGGGFSLCCLVAPAGAVRDVFFQLAFGAYVGALFNLNPLLERDGYHVIVDLLGEPGLRARALEQLRRRLSGGARATDSRLLSRYGFLVVAWTIVIAAFAIVMSLRYERALATALPGRTAWAVIAPIWLAVLAVPLAIVLPPLIARRRSVHT